MSALRLVRVLNVLVALVSAVAGVVGLRGHLEAGRRPVAFTVSVTGERETGAGIFAPLELLGGGPVAPDDRFQLRIRADGGGRLHAFAVHPGGRVQRLLGGRGAAPFRAGEAVVLPAGRHFYRVAGAPLTLYVAAVAGPDPVLDGPVSDPAVLEALTRRGADTEMRAEAPWSARLSDGTPVRPGAATVRGEGTAAIRIDLAPAAGPGGLEAPAAPEDGAGGEVLMAGGAP